MNQYSVVVCGRYNKIGPYIATIRSMDENELLYGNNAKEVSLHPPLIKAVLAWTRRGLHKKIQKEIEKYEIKHFKNAD